MQKYKKENKSSFFVKWGVQVQSLSEQKAWCRYNFCSITKKSSSSGRILLDYQNNSRFVKYS